MRESIFKGWTTPTRYLTATNCFSAAVGFLVGAYVARVLGPENFGIIAIISGINGTILAIVDVRLNDAAGRLYYNSDEIPSDHLGAYRAGVLSLAVLGQGIIGMCLAVACMLVGNFFIPWFTEAPVALWWLPIGALTQGVGTITGTLLYLLRFSEAFYAIGTCVVVSQILSAGITVAALELNPSLDGFYTAGVASAILLLFLTFFVSWHLWTRRLGLPLQRPAWRLAYDGYRRNLSMVVYGNFLSYAKLFQRSADVLVVSYFCDDRVTGIYKLARSLVDKGLAILQTALYQVYYPKFLDLFARREKASYIRLSRRILKMSALLTLAMLAGEALLLGPLLNLAFGTAYHDAQGPIMVLTATFVFIVGFHPWLWAIFVGTGELRGFTGAVFVSVLVQYAVIFSLFYTVGASALTAMFGLFAYYLYLIPAACWMLQRRWPEYMPWQTESTLRPVSDPVETKAED